jgi:hypothetical protein
MDIESHGREPHSSPIRISQNLRGFVHLEAISLGGGGYPLTAYPAKLLVSGFFLLLGRIGGKLVGVGFQHLLLVRATHCPMFNKSKGDKSDGIPPSSEDASFGRPRIL